MPEISGDNAVRRVLKHELTWIIFIVAMLWGFVTTVILPIKELQIQLTQVHKELASQDMDTTDIMKIHQQINDRLLIIEQKLR